MALRIRTPEGQPCVFQLPLQLTLRSVGKSAKKYRRHHLTLFTETGDHPLLVSSVPIELGKPTAVTLYLRKHPGRLLVRWSAESWHSDDEAWSMEMVAAGVAPGELRCIDNQVHGVLECKWSPSAPVASPSHRPGDTVTRKVEAAYKHLKGPQGPYDRFTNVQVHLGARVETVPLLFFSLLGHRGIQAHPMHVTLWWEHCLRVATTLASPGAALDELLTLASTLPACASWVYRADVTRAGREIDQWCTSLWSNPEGAALKAYDCEDGSVALMQLFTTFQRTELVRPSPALQRLQTLARKYTPWLAINELLSSTGSAKGGVGGGDYVLHCCLLLLPTRADADVAPISIESTAPLCSGPWRRDQKDTFTVHPSHFPKAADRLCAHVRTPTSTVRRRKMYGRLIALFTSGAAGTHTRSQHLLIDGVDTATFLLDPKLPAPAVDLPTAELEAMFAQELRLVPAPSHPIPASASPLPSDAPVLLPDCASKELRSRCTRVPISADGASVWVYPL